MTRRLFSQAGRAAAPRRRQWGRLAAALVAAACAAAGPATPAKDRAFDFQYAFTVKDLKPGQSARVWIPVATTGAGQDVSIVGKQLPADARLTADATNLNRMFYVAAVAGADGTVPLSVTYRVVRREITVAPVRPGEDVAVDLKADRLVPVGGRPGSLVDFKTLPAGDTAKARSLYDFVFGYMTYSKDKPGWGRGDVEWACDSRSGNCSDFHSLFLSLCRTGNLPAKMEFGFLIPTDDRPPTVANYHCWAFFKPAETPDWVPVDISMAKNRPKQKDEYFARLDANRLGFSTGRDLTLSPKQDGPPLNFFVYPYVEVDGKPWPAEKVVRSFAEVRPSPPATRPATVPPPGKP